MSRGFNRSLGFGIAFACLLTIALTAFDGRLHWDEPSFLYLGAYLDVQEILDGAFQANETPWFTHSRMLHILAVRSVASITGPGLVLLVTLAGIYSLFWIAGFALLWRLLIEIGIPAATSVGVLIAAAMPVSIYLVGKTLPESPAFAFAVLCSYGLWKVSSPSASARVSVLWCVVMSLALPVILLTKNVMVLMIASLGVTVLLIPLNRSRARLVMYGAVSAVAGFSCFLGFLLLLGMDLRRYLGLVTAITSESEPFVSLVLHAGLEAGVLFALVPLCLLGQRQRLSRFFLLWFVASTLPVLLLLSSVEARYLVPNLPALAGLFSLSIEWLSQKLESSRTPAAAAVSGIVAIMVLLPNAWFAQWLMAHEVEVGAMDQMVSKMRQEAGTHDPVVLCPFDYSTFYLLRVVDPELDVYTVSTFEVDADIAPATLAEKLAVRRRVLGRRMIENTEELEPLMDRPVFYFGFDESFPVANLRRLVSHLPGGLNQRFDELLGQLQPLAHLETSWLWEIVNEGLADPITVGHYRAYRIETARPVASSF